MGATGADRGWAVALGGLWALSVWLLARWSSRDAAWVRSAVHRAARSARQIMLPWAPRVLRVLHRRLAAVSGAAHPVGSGEISEMIDIVRLGLQAGLSFDASLDLFCENRTSALAGRLAEASLSWKTGVCSRECALGRAAEDLDARALESFALAVGQALALGAPLADTLAGQSREIRAAHRAEIERDIERAPVKLLIPTGTLILPALLMSILGPLLAASGMM